MDQQNEQGIHQNESLNGEDANVYIDNVGAFSTKQKIHLQLLDIILH